MALVPPVGCSDLIGPRSDNAEIDEATAYSTHAPAGWSQSTSGHTNTAARDLKSDCTSREVLCGRNVRNGRGAVNRLARRRCGRNTVNRGRGGILSVDGGSHVKKCGEDYQKRTCNSRFVEIHHIFSPTGFG